MQPENDMFKLDVRDDSPKHSASTKRDRSTATLFREWGNTPVVVPENPMLPRIIKELEVNQQEPVEVEIPSANSAFQPWGSQ